MPAPQIGVVVLAAGRSARMGTHKLLLPLGDQAVIARVVNAVLETRLRPFLVVLGHRAEDVRLVLPSGDYSIIENARFGEGLSSSLRTGINALPDSVAGALILLGDQPLISAADINQVARVAATTTAGVVTATYLGRRGHPVYFSRTYFAELQQVAGDEGGRAVISRHETELESVPIADVSAGLDVDEPADYDRVRAIWMRRHPV